jgi:SAM-dependent methyltransferase
MTAFTNQPAWPDAIEAYTLGRNPAETARLRSSQPEALQPESSTLLDRIGLKPGHSAIDLGCGPCGILDLLCAAVLPGGRVVGLDADSTHAAMARQYAAERGLGGVEVLTADARHTGFPSASFDLVHARTLLVNIPAPAEVITEMARLAKPGGWVAGLEADLEYSLCYPPLAEWDRLHELLLVGYSRAGAAHSVGRRLTELYRNAGLEQIGMQSHAPAYPADHTRRTIIPDLVRSMRPRILQSGLVGEHELDDLDRAVRAHLNDPRTVTIPCVLIAAWGRKPVS